MDNKDIKKKLKNLWMNILQLDDINDNDSFIQLGGDSIKSLELEIKIYDLFGIEISLFEIFKNMSVSSLSNIINEKIDSNEIGSIIKKAPKSDYYPATDSQKGMYALEQYKLQDNSLIMHYEVKLKGEIDIEQIEQIYYTLLNKHDAFKTSFESIDGMIVQCINDKVDGCFKYTESNNTEVFNVIKDFFQPFNLNEAPLFRMGLIKVERDMYILVLVFHHIIFDGISLEILLDEISDLLENKNFSYDEIDYSDYAYWQMNNNKENNSKLEEYWNKRLSGIQPQLNFPFDYNKNKNNVFKKGSHALELSTSFYTSLKKICIDNNITINTLLFSAYNILISLYTGQDDIVVSTLSSGRNHAVLNRIIGMFVKTIPIRTKICWESTFLDFCKNLEKDMMLDFAHEDYSYEKILDNVLPDLDVERKLAINPLSDTMFVFHNYSSRRGKLGKYMISPLSYNEKEKDDLDLYIEVYSKNNKIGFQLRYNAQLFKKTTVEKMLKRYMFILEQIVNNSFLQLKNISIATKEDANEIHRIFNNTEVEYNKDLIITQYLEYWAAKLPNKIAVSDSTESITYDEFNRKTNQFASYLRKIGIGPNDIVGVIAERSVKMLLIIFSIIKSGAAYMPISPYDPTERKKFIITNSGAKTIVLMDKKLVVSDCSEVNQLDFSELDLSLENDTNLEKINQKDDMAYIIYTSGSTGNPKGVMINHDGLINRLEWMKKVYNIDEKEQFIQKTTYTFDVSVWEIFLWSVTGASIYLPKPSVEKDPEQLIKDINNKLVSNIHFVPSMLEAFLDYALTNNLGYSLRSLKNIFCSGESLKKEQVKKFNELFKDNTLVKMHNLYGPTEATIDVTFYDCPRKDEETIPIGKPIDNIKLYILDKHFNMLPIGVPGELCISGVGVAKGYLNNDKLTKEKFVDNPFDSNNKLYKTGDLAKWLEDGNIQYLGRIDNQVKLRGFRIELEEVESKIREIADINESIVVLKNDLSSEPYLCAYYTSNKSIDTMFFKEFLSTKLPEYMIPTKFVKINHIPLTDNGKINKKALPEPVLMKKNQEKIHGDIEKRLAGLWRLVLGIEEVELNDNFFSVGGHSLKAIILLSKVRKEFNVEMTLKEVFEKPILFEMASFIRTLTKNDYESIQRVEKKEFYPVSYQQKRIYIAAKIEETGTGYNMPDVYKLNFKVNYELLKNAFLELVKRHEILRTAYKIIDGEVYQKVNEVNEFKLFCEEIKTDELAEKINEKIKSFDLGNDILLRAGIFSTDIFNYLFMDVHHLASDSISCDILINELWKLYDEEQLPEIKVQYKDYANWSRNNILNGKFITQEKNLLNMFSKKVSVVKLKSDYKLHENRNYFGNQVKFNINKEMIKSIQREFLNEGVSMHMFLVAVFKVELLLYNSAEDITIGTISAGRTHKDIENCVGPFINTLCIRTYPERNKKWLSYLNEVKDVVIEAFDNQDYPMELLIEKLKDNGIINTAQLFSLVVNYIDCKNYSIHNNERYKHYNQKYNSVKFDFTMNIYEHKEYITFVIDYRTALFKKETIEKLADDYNNILVQILNNKEILLGDIRLINDKDNTIASMENIEFNF